MIIGLTLGNMSGSDMCHLPVEALRTNVGFMTISFFSVMATGKASDGGYPVAYVPE